MQPTERGECLIPTLADGTRLTECCLDPADLSEDRRLQCDAARQSAEVAAEGTYGTQAPVTRGREVGGESKWNTFIDAGHTGTSDHRFGRELDTHSGYLTLGADRRFTKDLVAGVNLTFDNSDTDGFAGTWHAESDGFTVGPYFGYHLSRAWVLGGSLGVGWSQNENQIAIISGRHSSQQYSSSLSANGQYAFGKTVVRPSATLSYDYSSNAAHDMAGRLFGLPFSVTLPESGGGSATAEVTAEVSHAFRKGGVLFVPFVELRVENSLAGGPQFLTAQLSRVTTSPWSGSVQVGGRALLWNVTFVEASYAYMSLGHAGLDTSELRLFLSRAF